MTNQIDPKGQVQTPVICDKCGGECAYLEVTYDDNPSRVIRRIYYAAFACKPCKAVYLYRCNQKWGKATYEALQVELKNGRKKRPIAEFFDEDDFEGMVDPSPSRRMALFRGEMMRCKFCGQTLRSNPNITSGWTAVQTGDEIFYVCPTCWRTGKKN